MTTLKSRNRGIYLLPNLLTTLGLLAGFYAIISAIQGEYQTSAIAIFVAMLFDGLDGRVARLTNTQSTFGAEYDSMADMVSFGIAPAVLFYTWQLSDMGNLGWLTAFLYVASSALRLARFNTQIGIEDKNYFQGLPSPAAAAVCAGLVWFVSSYQITTEYLTSIALIIMALSAVLMVSNIRYNSFKGINLKGRSSFKIMLLSLSLIVLVSLEPSGVLFGLFFAYLISGITLTIVGLRKKRKNKS